MSPKLTSFFKTLGPGILFASTAIGVSHLVQSTRAGANFGFALLWAVVLANLFKYPFFEFGSRYANAAGESLIDGYEKVGKWMLILYFLITIGSMFFVTAAVGFVTAGFLENLFGISRYSDFNLLTTIILFVVCLAILGFGKFKALDGLVKIIGSVLVISTLMAFILTLLHGPVQKVEGFVPPEIWTKSGMLFMVALMGWMPTAVDLSTWNSLWTIERIKQTSYKPTLKETLLDFNLGYIASAVLSVCFVTLGAYLMFGSGNTLPQGSAGFANGVVQLYTKTIGNWSYFVIAVAAFSIMFGTSLAVFDGYARALERTSELLFFSKKELNVLSKEPKVYLISLFIVSIGAFFLIAIFIGKPSGFRTLVDIATTISFLLSPVIAIVNFKLVTGPSIPKELQPRAWLKALSYGGIVFLSGFSIWYLWVLCS